ASAVLLVVARHIPAGHQSRPLDPIGFGLLVVAGVSMGVCRRWPRGATVAVTVVLCGFIARNYPHNPVLAAGWGALVGLGSPTSRRTEIIGAAGMIAALTATAAIVGSSGLVQPGIYVGWSGAAVFLGEALRSRRRYLAGVQERAAVLERTREQEA